MSGALIAGGPLLLLLALRLDVFAPRRAWVAPTVTWVLALAAPTFVSLGGILLRERPRIAKPVLGLACIAYGIVVLRPEVTSPAIALAVLSTMAVGFYLIAPAGAPATTDEPFSGLAVEVQTLWVTRVRTACATALFGALTVALGARTALPELAVSGASLAAAAVVTAHALLRRHIRFPRARGLALGMVTLSAAMAMVTMWGRWPYVLGSLALVPFAALVLLRRPGLPSALVQAVTDGVLSHPARMLVVTFALLSSLGALLLKLPLASAPGRVISGIDAAFTATSAVCVTGLIVLDTPRDFSTAGHALILVLIQLGGLGIMSFSTAAVAVLGRRLSLRHERAVADLLALHRGDIFDAVRRILIVTFGVEAVGALVLWPLFAAAGDPTGLALWRALFTSVSAFCNAGFALQSDSLIPYQQAPGVLHTVSLLIIAGSLSPPVVVLLPRWLRRRSVPVHARVVLWVTVSLLFGGALIVGALEWSNTLRDLPYADRIHGAWFQSVTTRTAGFNSVDFAALRPATIWIMTALMFIGGSPGGTAGGIKTTTVAILFIAVKSAMRGRWEALAFGRRFSNASVYKAAALTTIAASAVVLGVVALEVTQPIPLDMGLFEVVSALATVGLSTGATSLLDDVGKVVLMACMFVGRVGPLTLFLFLRERHDDAPWHVPETHLDVG